MDRLRTPFFIATIVLIALALAVEIGSTIVLHGIAKGATDVFSALPPEMRDDYLKLDQSQLEKLSNQDKPPGYGIPYLAFLDGLLLFTVGLIGVGLVLPQRIHGSTQGCVTLIVSLLVILGGIAAIIVALIAVLIMVALLLSVPFGTIAYIALYGFFNTSGASVALGLIMTFKIAAAICLVIAQQRFLQSKGLVLLILFSLVGNIIVSFLHSFVPGLLVSIADGIAGIIVGILAVIWAIVFLIGGLRSVIKVIRVDKALA